MPKMASLLYCRSEEEQSGAAGVTVDSLAEALKQNNISLCDTKTPNVVEVARINCVEETMGSQG